MDLEFKKKKLQFSDTSMTMFPIILNRFHSSKRKMKGLNRRQISRTSEVHETYTSEL